MMELRQLTTFQTVANTLSFTRAAALLNYAQSSVTAQIQALEEELGVPLFDRLGKRVVLTDAGQRLVQYADKLLNLAEEAREVVSGGEVIGGTLTVSALETLCTYRLPSILRQFRDQFPHVRLIVRPLPTLALIRGVNDGAVDVCFVMAESLVAPGAKVEVLTAEPVQVIAAPGHPRADQPHVTAADLATETFLLTDASCQYRGLFERVLAAEGIHLSEIVEFGSVEAIKQCVMVGMGIAVLPAVTVANEVARGQLVVLRTDALQIYTQMIWHKDKWLSPALSAFMELCRVELGRANERVESR
jgi:DNA-binding transcriptional LysR family regulator